MHLNEWNFGNQERIYKKLKTDWLNLNLKIIKTNLKNQMIKTLKKLSEKESTNETSYASYHGSMHQVGTIFISEYIPY